MSIQDKEARSIEVVYDMEMALYMINEIIVKFALIFAATEISDYKKIIGNNKSKTQLVNDFVDIVNKFIVSDINMKLDKNKSLKYVYKDITMKQINARFKSVLRLKKEINATIKLFEWMKTVCGNKINYSLDVKAFLNDRFSLREVRDREIDNMQDSFDYILRKMEDTLSVLDSIAEAMIKWTLS